MNYPVVLEFIDNSKGNLFVLVEQNYCDKKTSRSKTVTNMTKSNKVQPKH